MFNLRMQPLNWIYLAKNETYRTPSWFLQKTLRYSRLFTAAHMVCNFTYSPGQGFAKAHEFR